jgi:ketosteroid isomerase-like protein
MSQENVETLRRVNAAFNRGDRDAVFAGYHHDMELRDLQHAPDAPERLIGIDAFRAYWGQWEDAFDDFTAEIEKYIDAGAYILAVTHWRARGKNSGLAIDLRTVDVAEFTDGKIVRLTIGYSNEDEALKAVGLEG